MKRKITLILLAAIIAVCGILALVSCNDDTEKETYYTVTLDSPGGTPETKSVRVKSGETLYLYSYAPSREGYTLSGWSAGTEYYPVDDRLTVTSDMTLTAVWKEIREQVTVTLDPMGGTLADARITVDKGSLVSLTDKVPVRDGYNFLGWSLGGETVSSFEVTKDTTVTAMWERITTPAENFTFELSEDGESYILAKFLSESTVTDVVVPGSYNGKPITSIKHNAFSYNDTVKSIDLTECRALVTIGSWNFTSCEKLESVTLAGLTSLEVIGDCCFCAAPALSTLDISGLSALREIGSSFLSYTGVKVNYIPLETLDFSDCTSLETIGRSSFWYMSALRELDFSKTKLTSIGNQFILHCDALEKISLPATISAANIGSEFLTYAGSLREIALDPLNIYLTLQGGVLLDVDMTEVIKAPANCGITEFVAPATLIKVRESAFADCETLTSADLSAATGLSVIGWMAFSGCAEATVSLPCNAKGVREDGGTLSLGNSWNSGIKATSYIDVLEINYSGIKDGATVTAETITISAAANYGTTDVTVTVKLNGTTVDIADGAYTLSPVVGNNTLTISAEYEGHTALVTITFTRASGDPTIETTLEPVDGKIVSGYGQTINFKITAKDSSGAALDSSHIEIYRNWGYGASKQEYGVTMTDNSDGTITVSLSYDQYADSFWLFDDTIITLTIKVSDGGLSAEVSYTVDWKIG